METPRFAVGAPSRGEEVTFEVLHEVLYTLAGDVIKDNLAPAQIRETGEDVLTSRVAVRGAALLLARAAPARVPAFERFYLAQVRRTAPASNSALQAAFEQAFPLPDSLVRGLEKEIQSAFQGI
jgi:hypothetical protein